MAKVEVSYVDIGGFHCGKRFSAEIYADGVGPRSKDAKKIEKTIKNALKKAGFTIRDVPSV